MIKGAYIHIPFCEHICYYCDFNKYFIQYQPVDDYLQALETEIQTTMANHSAQQVETVYIGGGTPSALNVKQLQFLMDIVKNAFNTRSLKEWTVEVNPENFTAEKLRVLKNAGVTRLSVGVQTFNDELLASIGRAHTAKQAVDGIELARKEGFDNLSVDLMFGLPHQSADDLETSLEAILKIAPEHVSIYSLQIEPKTIFFNRMRKGKMKNLPSEDLEADMYETIIRRLEQAGLYQYEISNFAKPGAESAHNLIYWDNDAYFGFGAGAHGYVDGVRTVNAGPVSTYLRLVKENGTSKQHEQPVTVNEQIEEEMFLGLRKTAGINKTAFIQKYNQPMDAFYKKEIEDLKSRGLLTENEQSLVLTKKGLFIGNEVFQAFLA